MELHILLQAGITFGDGILMIQDDEPDKEGKALLQKLIDSLENGNQLSTSLKEAECFPAYMTSMIEIGEKTGRISETMKALSKYYDNQDRVNTSIKNAVLYPAILLVLMMAVVIVLLVKVLPIFNGVFSQLGTQMTPLAAKFMQFGDWLARATIPIVIIIGIITVLAILVWVIPTFRKKLINIFKNILGAKSILGEISTAHFTSAMALSLASGLDAEKSVEMAADVSGGIKKIDEKHKACLEALYTGVNLAEAMRNAKILSSGDSRMLSLGERSGTTDTVIADIATRAERNVHDSIERIVSKIEPTLVIVTSIIVGVILFSVMSPLMNIMTSIG